MKWDVAFPIEGFTLDVIKPFSVDDATFELNNPEVFYDPNHRLELHQIKDIRILGVARAVDGKDTHEVKSLAYQRVEEAVNIVQFLVIDRLRTVSEVYFVRPLDSEGPVKIEDTINNGFRAMHEVRSSLSLDGLFPGPKFDAQKYIDKMLKPFGTIRPERKETLGKALSYYRIGVSAYNPYQAIESFFGAIQAIVRKEKDIPDVTSKMMEDHIKPILLEEIRGMTDDEFDYKFACFWRRYRSFGTHGKYHVNYYPRLRGATIASQEVAKWTWVIINRYVTQSSKA